VGVGAGGRNDPSIVCTYELKKKSTSLTKTQNKPMNLYLKMHSTYSSGGRDQEDYS
jgi:hypothetical protein